MDCVADTALDLATAVRWLRSQQQPGLDDAVRGLRQTRNDSRMARVLAELEPERFAAVCEMGPAAIRYGESDVSPLARETLDAVEQLFPLGWSMEQGLLEAESDLYLELDGVGNALALDWWYNGLTPGEFEADDGEASLDFFCLYLLQGIIGEEWEAAQEYFDWPISSPIPSVPHELEAGDLERIGQAMQTAGLALFLTALKIANACSGNFFLDFDPSQDEFPPFMLENVRMLEREWRAAQVMLSEREQAVVLVQQAPRRWLNAILDAFRQVFPPGRQRVRIGEPPRPYTLLEMWADDEEPDEETEDLYPGPLTEGPGDWI